METQTSNQKGFKPKSIHFLAIILILAVVIGIYIATSKVASVVAVGDSISVYYTGTFTNGTVFDSNVGRQPLNFTVGSGQLIRGFDQGVVGMKLEENRTITLPPSEAYGEINQSLILTVPRSQLGNLTPSVGMILTSGTGQRAVIAAFNSTNVTVDLNSPLAGKTLIFQIKVVAIKK